MSYTFPHFNDILYPELVNFADTLDIANSDYCKKLAGSDCKGCVFNASPGSCAAASRDYTPQRQDLLAYVKLHHPEYLL